MATKRSCAWAHVEAGVLFSAGSVFTQPAFPREAQGSLLQRAGRQPEKLLPQAWGVDISSKRGFCDFGKPRVWEMPHTSLFSQSGSRHVETPRSPAVKKPVHPVSLYFSIQGEDTCPRMGWGRVAC